MASIGTPPESHIYAPYLYDNSNGDITIIYRRTERGVFLTPCACSNSIDEFMWVSPLLDD